MNSRYGKRHIFPEGASTNIVQRVPTSHDRLHRKTRSKDKSHQGHPPTQDKRRLRNPRRLCTPGCTTNCAPSTHRLARAKPPNMRRLLPRTGRTPHSTRRCSDPQQRRLRTKGSATPTPMFCERSPPHDPCMTRRHVRTSGPMPIVFNL